MSEKIQEFLDIPQEFVREGNQVRRFTLVTPISFSHRPHPVSCPVYKALSKRSSLRFSTKPWTLTDLFLGALEFMQISKAVAIGFAVMGFIGYLVKLIHIPM